MIFSPDLCELILAGKKTVTRRPVKYAPYASTAGWLDCRYQEGRSYAVQPGRGAKSVGRILIRSATREPLGNVAHRLEARREGFATVGDFVRRWEDLYGSHLFSWAQEIWRIEFELVAA